jgi:hypothetical protein
MYAVTNNSKALQGVFDRELKAVYIQPGDTVEIDLSEADYANLSDYPQFTIAEVADKAAADQGVDADQTQAATAGKPGKGN